ncbi:MAG: transposase [Nitrospirae bacterium]|nr:transposase [Nitrospirota bacterium]
MYLGANVRLPVRIVAIPIPQKVANERRRKLKQSRDKRLNTSIEQLALLDWEVFITNVPIYVWNTNTVASVYGIRWRIEIIFKAWKSHFNFTVMTDSSRYHIESLIYARLIFVILFQSFFQQIHSYILNKTGKHLSLLKAAQSICLYIFAMSLVRYSDELLDLIIQQFIKHCCYEKRKNRANYM